MEQYKMIINGEAVAAVSADWETVINPATEDGIAEVPQADYTDVDNAVTAAKSAFTSWSQLSPAERSTLIYKLADALEAKTDRLTEIESLSAGKPMKLVANGDVPFAIDNIRYFAGQARVIEGIATKEFVSGYTSTIRREPVGVVASIAPWNYPIMMAAWKIAPAIAAGNTVVIKPAPQTPLTTLMLAQTALEVGFPPGVINVVTGGASVGEPLISHPDVRMVSFTGSTRTGKRIMELAAQKVTRVHLELGGKAPLIVFADADIAAAAQGAVVGAYVNTGQDCTAATRILVERSRYQEFLAAFTELAQQVRLGTPQAETTDMGPLISADQRQRVHGFVERAKNDSVSLKLGGEIPDGKGFFYQPTIFCDAPTQSEIMQEEVFGPVVVVNPIDSEQEAIAVANDVKYGLAASVWTKDIIKAWRVASALEFGTVWINDHLPLASEMPHGGFKESGFGKDLSRYAMEEYTIAKHIMFDLSGDVKKPWHFTAFGDAE
ncbi:aminobutyraldehyde dehydrogenase [Chroogloeocystis siderophila]|uniref:Gamma-aminobutyraldehyde dehydrogenase n=1 Tax=Chroogloeocystis siderophila 5.2 s.c.1 TaxID=247279 RepID=A0A1U7HVM2_9CHRO|nr:aminobutyraldehyde dehydrogenase [Chroogloeocystis siderophila]OKH27661.1 gamma-aminobutyraldehyde dehydrogenase [Chroogloeocystis siderophila 5.2 s.c.1]